MQRNAVHTSKGKISPLKLACMLIPWCHELLQLFAAGRKLGESNEKVSLFSYGPFQFNFSYIHVSGVFFS
jgi:hypothetical protein